MTALVLARSWDRSAASPEVRIGRLRFHWVIFWTTLTAYLMVGTYLSLALHAMHGDAYSRVSNAFYVLFSRDPHLAAIGFVWPPLPSLFELLFVPLAVVWPPIVTAGFAAVIMSATFMAGAVHQVNGTLADLAVPRFWRLLLVLAFALHPMILYYAAIGTAEAPTLFFLVLAVRYLARWVRDPEVGPLVVAGLGLAGAYLTRYEAMFSAVGAASVVALITLARSEGNRRERRDAAIADVAIILAPFSLAFIGWAIASWLIVGSPFTQFTSAYGNTSQLAVWAAQGANELGLPLVVKAPLALDRLGALEIALPLALMLAAIVAWRRHDARCLAAIAVLGPALGFMVFAYLTNSLAPWLRYFILAIPLGVLLLGSAIGGLAKRRDPTIRSHLPIRLVFTMFRTTTLGLMTVAALVALPAAAVGMLDGTIAVEEARDLAGVLGPTAAREDRPGAALRTFASERAIALYLDGLDLPRGSILLDTFSGFSIVTQSAHPERFVITPDHDFRAVLADPTSFGVRYLLAPATTGNGVLDAINVAYPSLFTNGAGFAVLERTFEEEGGVTQWRLYRVLRT